MRYCVCDTLRKARAASSAGRLSENGSRALCRISAGGQLMLLLGIALLDKVAERGAHEDAEIASRLDHLSYSLFGLDDGISSPSDDIRNAAHEVAVPLLRLFRKLAPRNHEFIMLLGIIRLLSI